MPGRSFVLTYLIRQLRRRIMASLLDRSLDDLARQDRPRPRTNGARGSGRGMSRTTTGGRGSPYNVSADGMCRGRGQHADHTVDRKQRLEQIQTLRGSMTFFRPTSLTMEVKRKRAVKDEQMITSQEAQDSRSPISITRFPRGS